MASEARECIGGPLHGKFRAHPGACFEVAVLPTFAPLQAAYIREKTYEAYDLTIEHPQREAYELARFNGGQWQWVWRPWFDLQVKLNNVTVVNE